jgi:hypothetical protein
MNKSSRRLITGLIGLIVISVTLVGFFIGFGNGQKENIDYIALVFVLISELVLFGMMIFIDNFKNKANGLFLHSGIISALVLYWIATTLISILLPGVLKDNINAFITVQILVLALSAIIVLLIIIASSAVKDKGEKTAECNLLLQECERMVFSLKSNKKYKSIGRGLSDLYDELRFSDKSSSMQSEDSEINVRIIELKGKLEVDENDESHDIKGNIEDIILLIKNRNMAVKQLKSGGC